MPKLKNIIIFVIIGAVFVSIYFYIKRPSADPVALISSSGVPAVSGATAEDANKTLTQDYLALLLSVKNIKLDDSIFSNPAFTGLYGSHSITLIPDGTEGRINPFAPFGSDNVLPPPINTGSGSAGSGTSAPR